MTQINYSTRYTKSELWTIERFNRITILNSNKKLDYCVTAYIDEASGDNRTMFKINGIKEYNVFSVCSNKNSKKFIERLHNIKDNMYCIDDDLNSKECKNQIDELMKYFRGPIYGIDYLCLTPRAREGSFASKNYKKDDLLISHTIHYIKDYVLRFNFPIFIEMELAGDFTFMVNNIQVIKELDMLGYNIKIIPYMYSDFEHPSAQQRTYFVAYDKSLNFEYNFEFDNIDKDSLDYRNILEASSSVPNRFWVVNGLIEYGKQMQQKNHTQSYRPKEVNPKKKLFPPQTAIIKHTGAVESYIRQDDRLRFLTSKELCNLYGWPNQYLNLINYICNDIVMYRILNGGMCYDFISKHFRIWLCKFFKSNGKLEAENWNELVQERLSDKNFTVGAQSYSWRLGGNLRYPKKFLETIEPKKVIQKLF